MNFKFILKYSSRKRILVMLTGMTSLVCAIFTTGIIQSFSFCVWLIIGILLVPGMSKF